MAEQSDLMKVMAPSIEGRRNPTNNLLDPAILFFVFGVLAGALRSNLGDSAFDRALPPLSTC